MGRKDGGRERAEDGEVGRRARGGRGRGCGRGGCDGGYEEVFSEDEGAGEESYIVGVSAGRLSA